jgi:8-oxo-dGTP diphosphatase
MQRFRRLVFTVLGLIFRHPLPGVTLIVVLPDRRIVLVRRRDNGKWSLPGGFIDWGEDIPQAARRELWEETGLELTRIERLCGVYSARDRDPRLHSISVVLKVAATGQLRIRDTLELSDIRAFEQTELPLGSLSHDHDRQLQDYLNDEIRIA